MEDNPDKPADSPQQLPPDVIARFIQTQEQKALNEAEGMKLRSKELDINKELAIKAMDIDAQLATGKHAEGRKTVTRLAYIVAGLMIISFGFIAFCLYMNKEQFIIEFLKVAAYPASAGGGYYLGMKKNDPKPNKSGITDAEIIDD